MTLSGGHGTGVSWSKLLIGTLWLHQCDGSGDGLCNVGLVCWQLIGGPVARYLVKHSTTQRYSG
ncbi:sodium/glutamate symporter [Escherichia coli]